MGPARIHVTKVIVADEKSARAWGHCTVRGCKATMTCRIGWQPDHAIFTCFKLKEHHHPVHLGCNRREAIDLAASVSHNPPLRASAELLGRMPAIRPSDQPTDSEHRNARRRFLKKQPVRTVATRDGALAWQQRLAERVAFNAQQMQDGFLFYHLSAQEASWLPVQATRLVSKLTIPVGSCVFMSRHMVEATRAYVGAGGVKSLKQGVLLGDFSWKCCYSGYAMGLWAQASQHSYSAGTSSQHLPKSEAIPAAHQWAPKESIPAVALGLITMISVYLRVWNIDLTAWFSAVILDGHAAGQATVEMVLPGTLLGRDLAHQERNIIKNFSGADVTRSKRRSRLPKPRKQESTDGIHLADALAESSSAKCDEGDAPTGSVSAVCSQGTTPSEPARQDRPPSGGQLPASIQAAYAKANLQFVSTCCPTPVLESMAIETIIGMDITMGRDDLALYWQNFLAKKDPDTGLWQTLCSSNLMSGHVPGYTPSSCFQAEERTNRSLKEGIPRNAHKTSVDQATEFLQASSPLGVF